MAPPRCFTLEQERELVARYEAGMFVSVIARDVGRSHKAVKDALLRQGCVMRGQAEIRRESEERRHARGEVHPNWRGGRVMHDGYVLVAVRENDPMWSMRKATYGKVNKRGYVMEHRLVVARALKRPLTRGETVHHINGDREDNRIENLQLRRGRHGKGHAFQCASCGSHDIVAVPIG